MGGAPGGGRENARSAGQRLYAVTAKRRAMKSSGAARWCNSRSAAKQASFSDGSRRIAARDFEQAGLVGIGQRLAHRWLGVLQRLVIVGEAIPEFRVLEKLPQHRKLAVDGFRCAALVAAVVLIRVATSSSTSFYT